MVWCFSRIVLVSTHMSAAEFKCTGVALEERKIKAEHDPATNWEGPATFVV